MTDEELARALREAPDTAASAQPLDTEQLWWAAQGKLPPEETAAVVDRLAADPSALLAWNLARELHAASASASAGPSPVVTAPAEAPAPANSARWYRAATLLAIAAALLVAVRGLAPGFADRAEAPPVYRGVEDRPSLDPIAAAPGEPATVRWVAVPGARYTLVLRDADLREVITLDGLRDPEAVLPAEALARLPGGRGSVQLTVTTAEGSVRSSPAAVMVGTAAAPR